ncbi:MAG: aspartate aminotransferase family protein [Gammaproteobacteria bacterium]|nr:aspartate aminotransferase family protein [Gammaproteobacteria bacterium]
MPRTTLPARGRVWKNLEQQLLAMRAQDLPWHQGLFFFYWRRPGQAAQLAAREAASLFYNQLYIGEAKQPSGKQLGDDIADMTLDLLHAPPGASCALTQGGTESIFTGVLVARERARARGLADTPNLVIPNTAHPAFDKAAHFLGLQVRRVPEGPDRRADVRALAQAMDAHTLLTAVSAPCYPYGLMDPVAEAGELARAKNVWLHVDACCSFLLPFLREAGADIPAYDFSVPGVDSISVDLHKFAFAPPGISSFSLRDGANHRYHTFHHDAWSAGTYETDTFAGSRTTDVFAATWTVMHTLGRSGYVDVARQIRATVTALEQVLAGIPDLEIAVAPETMFFLVSSTTLDVAAVAEGMTERGYVTVWYELGGRPTIHLILDPIDEPDDFAAWAGALAEVCAEVRAGRRLRSGAEARYA